MRLADGRPAVYACIVRDGEYAAAAEQDSASSSAGLAPAAACAERSGTGPRL